ncbi:MAG: hypothetical protein AB7P76_07630 [Candidatus Melainabacteria bacterium]
MKLSFGIQPPARLGSEMDRVLAEALGTGPAADRANQILDAVEKQRVAMAAELEARRQRQR